MQNEAANKKIEMLFPKSDPLDANVISSKRQSPLLSSKFKILKSSGFWKIQRLTDLLFQGKRE